MAHDGCIFRVLLRFYRLLMLFLPQAVRQAHGRDLERDFVEGCRDALRTGGTKELLGWLRIACLDILINALGDPTLRRNDRVGQAPIPRPEDARSRANLYVLTKRAIDVVITLMMVLTLLPLWLAAAVAIRLDSPGPILFRQKRIGQYGREFVVYKFRTMRQDTDRGARLYVGPDGHLKHKVRDDPRVTRIGRYLRSTSIDEMPQLINILRGEMSLVGPRPELPEIVAHYEPWQHRRHLVKPGLTGWWQVSGRGWLPMHENTELDLYYVDNQSLGLDVKIMAKSVRIVLSGRGAF